MRVLVFGATGKTGSEVVVQGLKQGHIVTAFARRPEDITVKHDKLRVLQGDVLNYESVEPALRDQELVISALGTVVLKKNTILSDGTRNIIKAMDVNGVKRLLVVSSLGVGDTKRQFGPGLRGYVFKTIFMGIVLKNIFDDKEVQEQIVKQSDLDWIIVRPGSLTDGPLTGDYRAGFPPTDKKIQGKVSRADVADFLLRNVTDTTYVHKTPGLSY